MQNMLLCWLTELKFSTFSLKHLVSDDTRCNTGIWDSLFGCYWEGHFFFVGCGNTDSRFRIKRQCATELFIEIITKDGVRTRPLGRREPGRLFIARHEFMKYARPNVPREPQPRKHKLLLTILGNKRGHAGYGSCRCVPYISPAGSTTMTIRSGNPVFFERII